ncbi:MAG: hypothetical protein AAGF35_03735, partial [Pseudomonadota bacterium]
MSLSDGSEQRFRDSCGDACLAPGASEGVAFPFVFNDIRSSAKVRTSRVAFFWFRSPVDSQALWLHPLPFSFLVDQDGADAEAWTAHSFVYCASEAFAT